MLRQRQHACLGQRPRTEAKLFYNVGGEDQRELAVPYRDVGCFFGLNLREMTRSRLEAQKKGALTIP